MYLQTTDSRLQTFFLWLGLILGIVAVAGEAAQALATRQTAKAQALLVAERPVEALDAAEAALRWYPYQTRAQYSQLVALERLGRWVALAQAARRAADWNADSVAMLKFLGEGAWMTGQSAESALALWGVLWRTPVPWETPGQVWRLTMLASRQAWGDHDPRAQAAAERVLTIITEDSGMSETDRAAARREAEEVKRQEGLEIKKSEEFSTCEGSLIFSQACTQCYFFPSSA